MIQFEHHMFRITFGGRVPYLTHTVFLVIICFVITMECLANTYIYIYIYIYLILCTSTFHDGPGRYSPILVKTPFPPSR